MNLDITEVTSSAQLENFREVLREYAAWLRPVVWRGLERDIGNLPGKYAAPGGMWLGFADGVLGGSVALNPLNERDVEIKRLFVREAFRGRGYARALSRHAIAQAGKRGFAQVVLQVVRDNAPAIGLYYSLGFAEIPSYDEKLDQENLFLGRGTEEGRRWTIDDRRFCHRLSSIVHRPSSPKKQLCKICFSFPPTTTKTLPPCASC